MPLHLLGKKSWNVYNQDNIQKVNRDEAAAKALEEAEEQRMQEADAARRMQILRGETPDPLPEIDDRPAPEDAPRERRPHGSEREHRIRKKAGENETEYEMRVVQQKTLSLENKKQIVLRKPIDAPLLDASGHLDLFPREAPSKDQVKKNVEAEKELAKKKKGYEDQYTMKFSNAAGFKQSLERPWYSKNSGTDAVAEETPMKNVWGDEDPRRKQREAARMASSDPLAMMKHGAKQVRQVELERKILREEKERELRDLKDEGRRANTKRNRYHPRDDEELEKFKLDRQDSDEEKVGAESREREHRHRHKHRKFAHRSSRHEGEEKERDNLRHKHKDRHRD